MRGNEQPARRPRQSESRSFKDMRTAAKAGALVPFSGALDHLATTVELGSRQEISRPPPWPVWFANASRRPAHPRATGSGADAGGLDRHTSRARHQIKFEFDQLGSAVNVRLRTDTGDASTQPTLQGAKRLPLEPVERIPGRMPLRDRRARKALVPIVVMAVGAAEIELTLALPIQLTPFVDKGLKSRIGLGHERHSERLPRHESGGPPPFLALVSKWRCLLMRRAAAIDALFEIHRAAKAVVERGIMCGDAFHAGARVIMAFGAGLACRSRLAVP